jgi:branched-chain amino acid transport system ATP-binding protein
LRSTGAGLGDREAESVPLSSLLAIESLTTGYGSTAVVWDLSLRVEAGEVVALLGPNGAGKTTTLLTVSGLLQPLAGRIFVEGRSVVGLRPHMVARRGVAHVAEDRSLFYGLSVSDNLRLGQVPGRASGPDAVERVLDLFPALVPLLKRRAGVLSGGEQQMLALGRALVGGPRLLMIDEMSLGLAPVIVERILPVARAVADQTGAGVLLVEQHVHMALEIADRAYVLRHGRIAMTGKAKQLASDRNLIQASYLGDGS